MCIAIHKPAGIKIPIDHLVESFDSNPDGAGFAVLHPRKGLIIRKGFFSYDEFERAYLPFELLPALVHFRIATSGGVNPQMCHPFSLCNGQYAMIHNGIIDIKPHKAKSDTATFADAVLTPLLAKGIGHDSSALKFLVESTLGSWNKMLIMDRSGKVVCFNEKAGHTLNGVWYSNDTYLPRPIPQTSGKKLDPWEKGVWEQKFPIRGTLLNEERMCDYCQQPIEGWNEELYCTDCLEYMEYEKLK